MKDLVKIFSYKGNDISFRVINGVVMVNAVEMAQSHNKKPKDYLRTQSASELIVTLSNRQNCLLTDLVVVNHGGDDRGTWMQETIALDFAQWLSVDFRLWCNDMIKELMNHGATAINPESLLDPDYVIRVMTALKEERAQKELERSQKELAQAKLKEQAPDVKFANAVKKSESDCLIGSLAKMICQNGVEVGQKRLFQWMRDNGYLMRVGQSKNEPTQRSMNAELFRIIERRVELPSGRIIIQPTTMVTGKGQVYFINKFLKEEIEL